MLLDETAFAAEVIDVMDFRQRRRARCINTKRLYWALSYRYSGNSELQSAAGTVNPTAHSITLVPAEMDYVRIGEEEVLTAIHFQTNKPIASKIGVFHPADYTEYEKYFSRILHLWQMKDTAYRLKCGEYLMRIFAMICHEEETGLVRSKEKLAAQIIERNIANAGFHMGTLAGQLGVSEAYLRRIFNEAYGMPPVAYLIEKRMENAVRLIEADCFTVSEIAARCGYENEKYFSTAFKKRYHVSPSRYLHEKDAQ